MANNSGQVRYFYGWVAHASTSDIIKFYNMVGKYKGYSAEQKHRFAGQAKTQARNWLKNNPAPRSRAPL